MPETNERGFSLLETIVALAVLGVGLLGAAAGLASGMQLVTSAPGDLIATEKAIEAIESVISARDAGTLAWAQILNVEGESGTDGGVFLDGPQSMQTAGADGVLDTADDGDIETVDLPGEDEVLGTGDDEVETLDRFTREIAIRELSDDLRSITVTIRYQVGGTARTYSLATYISNYS
jgi:prepilin-type N-terminal cleavage/methylation domain-containing protein